MNDCVMRYVLRLMRYALTHAARCTLHAAFTPHLVKPRSLERGWMCGKFIISYFRKPRPLGRGAGFTFIELLIVVIVIGILIGVSIPQFRKTFDNFELENFVKDIYYLSRYLQGRAIGEEKICCLNIALEKKELWATYKGEGEFKKIEGKFGKNYKFPEGVNVTLNPMGQSEITSIYFYPDGSIDRITITFENRHKKQVSLIVKGAAGVIQIQ